MINQKRSVRLLATTGMFAGLAAGISIVIVGDTFGFPGSAAYRTYESFNRAMAIMIFLQSSALFAFYLHTNNQLAILDRTLIIIAFVAWIGMSLGTAAEFWLFSDLPYSAANMRSASFSVFSLSSLISGFALFGLGFRTLLGRRLSRGLGIVLMLYLPLDILFFVSGRSIFLAAALVTIVIAGYTLVRLTDSSSIRHEAA